MFGILHFSVFLATSILLNLTPGPDTFYILGRSMAQGRRAGIASALGISTGAVIHTLAAAFGLSALLTASPAAFLGIKIAGGVYLVYLGVRMLLTRRPGAVRSRDLEPASTVAIFRQGVLTNVLNPKVALFFLAFMPQFIAPESPAKFAAFLALGLTFVTTGTLWCVALSYFAASIGDRLPRTPLFEKLLNRIAGGIFVMLGLRLVTVR